MIVPTLDDAQVEVTHCDAGYPPGSPERSLMLNVTAVWCKLPSGEWVKSKHRSAIKTAELVRHTTSKDLKETLSERTEASGGGDGADDATKLQSLQGHSAGNADEDPAGNP